MEEDLDCYLALASPEASDWPEEDKQLAGVLRTFRVRQPFPLLLAGKRKLEPVEFTGLLRATMVISMRFNVILSYSPSEQERVYNDVAKRLSKGEIETLMPLLQAMRSIYPEDKVFRSAFAEKLIRTTDARNNRVVRLILCALERHISGQELNFISDAFNIEHILPQKAHDGWGGMSADDVDAMAYRLGNMTLLKSSSNRDLGTVAYAEKRTVYQQSGFELTRRLAQEYADWTPQQIAARQQWMANQATTIWRIAQLSA